MNERTNEQMNKWKNEQRNKSTEEERNAELRKEEIGRKEDGKGGRERNKRKTIRLSVFLSFLIQTENPRGIRSDYSLAGGK